jgi:Protein of unknown function (DUF2637)
VRSAHTGRAVAWLAFALGVAASVAANVAHARPESGPRLASAFAPVALLLTVEIMSRVPWSTGRMWALSRWAGTGAVALVAAVTSYRHMSALLVSYGEDRLTALIQPVCVDGLMVVASLALLALGAQHDADADVAAPAGIATQPESSRPPRGEAEHRRAIGVVAPTATNRRRDAAPVRAHEPVSVDGPPPGDQLTLVP